MSTLRTTWFLKTKKITPKVQQGILQPGYSIESVLPYANSKEWEIEDIQVKKS